MSDDAQMALVCLGLPAILMLAGIVYFAYQDWILADATKKAIEAQKEIYLNMPDKCRECPYCRQKGEKK